MTEKDRPHKAKPSEGREMATTEVAGRLLSLQETAAMLGISVQTLYGWRHRGLAPRGYRLTGGLVRFRESDVLDWLESQADEPRRAVSG